jgi:hypothetical protein
MKKHIVSLWAISCLVLFSVQTAFAQPASLPVGTKVTVTDIHKEDSYFSDKTRFIGKTGEVINNPLSTSSVGKGWYSGAVKLDGESGSNYFYAISLKIGDAPVPATKQSVVGKSTATTIPAGKAVVIVDISEEDAYFDEKDALVGKTGKVSEGLKTSSVGKGWYGGEVVMDGGLGSKYFYAVALSTDGAPAPVISTPIKVAGKSTATTIPAGKSVVIVDISEEDAYFNEKDALVGKTGKVKGELKTSSAGKGWYGGEVAMDGGLGTKYFYAVAISTDGAPASGAATSKTIADRATSSSIPKGTSVVVVDISPEDSYYSNKDLLIGKTGKISEGLTISGEGKGWFSGEVILDGAGSKYFYAVAVAVEGEAAGRTDGNNNEKETAATIPEGSTVMILSVSPEDAYYDDRETIEGKIGKVIETLTLSDMGDGWYGGEVILEGEEDSLYFYAVSVKVIKK